MNNRAITFGLGLITFTLLLTGSGCTSGGKPQESKPGISASGSSPKETIRIAWTESAKWGKDNIADKLKALFNIDFNFISLNRSDADNKINVMVASGDVPDMFYYPALDELSTKPAYIKWAEQGILKPIPEDLSKYPNIEKVMKQYDYLKVNGKHYSIPRLAWKPENQHLSVGLLVRTDYLQNVGIQEMPDSLDSFVQMLTAFRDKDPDQNGKNDTIPFSPGNVGMILIQGLYGLTNGWIMEDGKYVPSQISRKYLAFTKFFKTLYDEKLLDPDFATEVPEQINDKFIGGTFGAIGAQIEATLMKVNLFDKMVKVVPNALQQVDLLPLTKGPYGDPVMTNQFNHYSATLFNAQMSDEKMERCLQLYDYLLSDQGLELMRWGIEGEDFKKVGNQYVSLLAEKDSSGQPKSLNVVKPTSLLKFLVSWDVDGGWDHPSLAKELVDLEKKHIAIYQKYAQKDAGAKINYLFDPVLDKFNYVDLSGQFFNNAVLGKFSDIDGEFKKMVNEVLTKRNGAEAIEVANENVSKLK